jgi:hypothetical protein
VKSIVYGSNVSGRNAMSERRFVALLVIGWVVFFVAIIGLSFLASTLW